MEETYKITSLKVRKIEKFKGSGWSVNIIINKMVQINDIMVFVGNKTMLHWPSDKVTKGGEDRWYPKIKILDDDVRNDMEKEIYQAVEDEMGDNKGAAQEEEETLPF